MAQEGAIPELESFFDDFMLLEMVLNKYKPRYYLKMLNFKHKISNILEN